MKIAFTGHRPEKVGGYTSPNPKQYHVMHAMWTALEEMRPSQVISGMALGVDMWAAEIALDLGIPLVAALPFEGQEKMWPEASQRQYWGLLRHATEVVYVCGPGYAAWKMQKRNVWMVDHCNRLIAVWDGTEGGTANCVKYAFSKEREVYRINPSMLGFLNVP